VRKQDTLKSSQEARRKENWPKYIAYLREDEKTLQRGNAELYGAFEEERLRSFESMKQFNIEPAKFQTEDARLLAFAEFFAKHPKHKVLDFGKWDRQVNQNSLEVSNA
jgi:hypothetical protein